MSRPGTFEDDLDSWLTPFLDAMGRSTRRRWGPAVYLRGLLGPDGPKSVQPIATRLGLRGHDQLHQFISSAAWDDAPLWRVLWTLRQSFSRPTVRSMRLRCLWTVRLNGWMRLRTRTRSRRHVPEQAEAGDMRRAGGTAKLRLRKFLPRSP